MAVVSSNGIGAKVTAPPNLCLPFGEVSPRLEANASSPQQQLKAASDLQSQVQRLEICLEKLEQSQPMLDLQAQVQRLETALGSLEQPQAVLDLEMQVRRLDSTLERMEQQFLDRKLATVDDLRSALAACAAQLPPSILRFSGGSDAKPRHMLPSAMAQIAPRINEARCPSRDAEGGHITFNEVQTNKDSKEGTLLANVAQAVPQERFHEADGEKEQMILLEDSNGNANQTGSRKATAKASRASLRPPTSHMKTKVNLRDERFRGPDYNMWLGIIMGNNFDHVSSSVIIVNAILTGIQVEHYAKDYYDASPVYYSVLEFLFALVYSSELVLRGLALKSWFFHVADWRWNVFDCVCVTSSWLEVFLDVLRLEAAAATPVVILSRVVRVVRVARILRVVRFFEELQLMIFTLMSTARALFWSAVLCLLIMYTFSLVLVQAVVSYVHSEDHDAGRGESLVALFGNLEVALLTLFQSFTGGLSWEGPASLLLKTDGMMALFYIVFIFFMFFGMINVVTGFFCEHAADIVIADKSAAVEEQKREKTKYIEQFRSIFLSMDEDGSGEISLAELEAKSDQEALHAYLAQLDMDFYACLDVWELLDLDGNGILDVDEFVEGLLSLRGLAKTIDLAAVSNMIKKELMSLAEVKDMVIELRDKVKS